MHFCAEPSIAALCGATFPLRCPRRRPGILVLVNDADWELEGQLDYELHEGDAIAFISTLHGG